MRCVWKEIGPIYCWLQFLSGWRWVCWKAAGRGADSRCHSLGPKQAAALNHRNLEKRRERLCVAMHPSFLVCVAKLLFPSCAGCFHLTLFVAQSPNEGQYVRMREFTQTLLRSSEEHQKQPLILLILVPMRLQSKVEAPPNERRDSASTVMKWSQ